MIPREAIRKSQFNTDFPQPFGTQTQNDLEESQRLGLVFHYTIRHPDFPDIIASAGCIAESKKTVETVRTVIAKACKRNGNPAQADKWRNAVIVYLEKGTEYVLWNQADLRHEENDGFHDSPYGGTGQILKGF